MEGKSPINPVVAGVIIVIFLAVVGYFGFKAVAGPQYHGGPVNMGAVMKKGGATAAPPARPGMPGRMPGGAPGGMPPGARGAVPGGASGGAGAPAAPQAYRLPGGEVLVPVQGATPTGAPGAAPGAGGR